MHHLLPQLSHSPLASPTPHHPNPNTPLLPQSNAAVQLVVMPGVEVSLPMAGLFDAAKEIERLKGQRAKIDKEAEGLRARLKNPKASSTIDVTGVGDGDSKW